MSIFDHFQHLSLTTDQENALTKMEAFLDSPTEVFMLKGYAGSGKTTLLKGLVEYLSSNHKGFYLMAPTGRAAKVLKTITGHDAATVHKSIFGFGELMEVDNDEIEGGKTNFYYYKIRNNIDVAGKIFIVDEASMLSDAKSQAEFYRFGTDYLLSDLFTYTRVNIPNVNSKIIFVGDPAQLPPVTDDSSKAFEAKYLSEKFKIRIESAELKEVKRQDAESGIMKAARKLRTSMTSGFFNDFNLRKNGKDIFSPSFDKFLEIYAGVQGTKIIITYKNRTCQELNRQIRNQRFGSPDLPIQQSDIIIIGHNNYRKGIMNGEFGVVAEVSETTTSRTVKFYAKGGKDTHTGNRAVAKEITLTWRWVELVFPDSDEENKIVKGYVLENALHGENNLTPDEIQALQVDFSKRHPNLKRKSEEYTNAMLTDDYFNCILLKFGYAVTCHKAQGGEWDSVFTVWDYNNAEDFNCFTDTQRKEGKTNIGFYRWAYTAITRASKTLYTLNPPYFNSYSSMSFFDASVVGSLNELTGQQIQAEEIINGNEMLQQLKQFNLLEMPVPLQDHFIKVRHATRKQYIDIIHWEKKNLEIFYYFRREDYYAAIKTWVNKDIVFNNKYQKLPTHSNNDEFYELIEGLLKNLPNVFITRNTAETIVSKIEYEYELEEQFPFTRSLFDDISLLFEGTEIIIVDIEHLQYKERYTFKRNQEIAVIDFEYKNNGFFGRVIPIRNKTNSLSLVSCIQSTLQTLKKEEPAN